MKTTIIKVSLGFLYIVFLMIAASFIGTLLTVPSTIANIFGVILIVGIVIASYFIYIILNKTFKDE